MSEKNEYPRLNIGRKAQDKYGNTRPGVSWPERKPPPGASRHWRYENPQHGAREMGHQDGLRGVVDANYMNNPELRHSYIGGWFNGSTWRHADRLGYGHFEFFDLLYRSRDPHREPSIWLAQEREVFGEERT